MQLICIGRVHSSFRCVVLHFSVVMFWTYSLWNESQIDALLPNVRPKYSRSAPLDKILHSLHSLLNTIKPISPRHPLEASRELQAKGKGIAVPYPLPLPTEDTNWKVSFEKPSEIVLVGSWPNKLSVKPKDGEKFGVDVGVVMPEVSIELLRRV